MADIRFSLLVAAHNFSFKSVQHVVETAKLNFKDSVIAKRISQSRTKCTSIVKNVLSENIKDELSNELKNNVFSILVDESSDISNTRLMCILVRYIDSNSEVKTQLLDLIPIGGDEGNAKGLYNLFKNSMERFKLSVDNVVGFCSDNASVMLGKKNSFKTHLVSENTEIIVNGCVCHSAHLVAVAASQEIPSYVEALIQNIYSYFSRSPKRQSILEEFQKFMHFSQLKILSPSKTRWLALSNCVNRVLQQWDVLVELFREAAFEDKNPVGNMIFSELQNPYVKAYLHFLNHVLPLINKFNAMFQSQKVSVQDLYPESRRFIRVVAVNFIKPSFLSKDEKLDNLNIYDPNVLLSIEEVNVGEHTLETLKDCSERDKEQFKLICVKFYQKCVSDAYKRFPMNNLYKNMSFVIPKIALTPDTDKTCDLSELAEKYERKVDKYEVVKELNTLKVYFSETEKEKLLGSKNSVEFWSAIGEIKSFDDEYIFPNIAKLAKIILVLPHGNADVERVFSMMTDIKTKKRNRLNPETLSDLLRVKLDMQNKHHCCISYPITESHISKFGKCMYQFSNKDGVVESSDDEL